MLVIRNEQFVPFSGQSVDRYTIKAEEHLRKNFPSQCEQLGDEGVRGLVQESMIECEGYGLTTEFQMLHFLNFHMILGREFLAEPETAAILQDEKLDGRAKIDRLDNRAIERLGDKP